MKYMTIVPNESQASNNGYGSRNKRKVISGLQGNLDIKLPFSKSQSLKSVSLVVVAMSIKLYENAAVTISYGWAFLTVLKVTKR